MLICCFFCGTATDDDGGTCAGAGIAAAADGGGDGGCGVAMRWNLMYFLSSAMFPFFRVCFSLVTGYLSTFYCIPIVSQTTKLHNQNTLDNNFTIPHSHASLTLFLQIRFNKRIE